MTMLRIRSKHVIKTLAYAKAFEYSGHLRYDYLIKYEYFSKCYLERFVSISAPEK